MESMENKMQRPIQMFTYIIWILFFFAFKSHSHVQFFIDGLQRNLLLSFTYEEFQKNHFKFVDFRMNMSQ